MPFQRFQVFVITNVCVGKVDIFLLIVLFIFISIAPLFKNFNFFLKLILVVLY